MKKLVAAIGLICSLFLAIPAFATTNALNVEGNAWDNATFTLTPGTCTVSDSVNIDNKQAITIYLRIDNPIFNSSGAGSGGHLSIQLSPNGTQWYTWQGFGQFQVTEEVDIDREGGQYNLTFFNSTSDWPFKAKLIRFKSCYDVVNLSLSVFAR